MNLLQKFKSVRSILTLWYTFVLLLAFVIFSVSVYVYLAHLLEQRLDGSCWVRFRKKFIPLRPLPKPAPVAASPSGLRPPALAAKKQPTPQRKYKPAPDHPWREPFKRDTPTLQR